MKERFCTVGEIELCYETFGDPSDPALLLVMGLGTQMLAWHGDLCALLAQRGFHVIRFDNRDVGRSTWLSHARPPTLLQLARRDPRAAAYSLEDMADDAVGLLDCLGVPEAHVVGASMGGMIAQTVAARHPQRVASLVSIMSSTGSRWSGQPGVRIYPVFVRRPRRDRATWIEDVVKLTRLIGSSQFPRDEVEVRRYAAQAFDRGQNPAGSGRQLAAIFASGDRTPLLRRITAPTVVIHGTADRMVAPSGGRATARAIPGARLVTIDGMGHDLPRPVWPQIVDAIAANATGAPVTLGASAQGAGGGRPSARRGRRELLRACLAGALRR